MKDVDAYLPPELQKYQRRPNILWKIWLVASVAILAAFWLNTVVYPPMATYSDPTPSTTNQTDSQEAQPARPATKAEIRSSDEPGKYKIFENGSQVGRLKLASAGGVLTVKFYDLNERLALKTKLKPNEAVNVYDDTGKRIGKVKYKKGSYQFREMGSSPYLARDIVTEINSLDDALFFFFPFDRETRRTLSGMKAQLVFPEEAPEPDDSGD